MTVETATSSNIFVDLDARHEELLRKLDELDQRIQKVLAECQSYRVDTPTLAQTSANNN